MLSSLLSVPACSSDDSDDGGGVPKPGDGTPEIGGIGGATGNGTGGSGMGGVHELGPYMLPSDFTGTDQGGFKVGEEINAGDKIEDLIDDSGCDYQIVGIVRDFKAWDGGAGHPDFERYTGNGAKGIVKDALGSDKKPVLSEGDPEFTTTKEDFDEWYRNTDGINRAYVTYFSLEPNDPPNESLLTFKSNAFFPIDDLGWGNQGQSHNFGFTTEIHTEFVYNGGETFSFTGDDDLWVFINNKLAIDLGGLHPEQSDSVSLDSIAQEFGLTKGQTYPLDLFHAERHTDQSNFRIDTTLQFVGCGTVIDDDIIR